MPALTCMICSEVYTNSDVVYSTSCGHVFHFACVQQWQSRSTCCAQCREHNPTTHRLFLDFDDTDTEQKLNEVKALLDETEKSKSVLQLQYDECEKNLFEMQRMLCESEEKKIDLESANQYLKAQNDSREEEIGKLMRDCSIKTSEESELIQVQLRSLEENHKEVLLELEKTREECLKLREVNNKQVNVSERSELLLTNTRRQYEAVERGLKAQIDHLIQEISVKTTLIEEQKTTITELTKSTESCFKTQKPSQYINVNSTELLMQKLALERELERSLDKILELEECQMRSKEMLNLEIESLKADIERKDNEIKNRRDEHAKMMDRLSTLGSKATEISLRKRNEMLTKKLEDTRLELEKAFRICAEKDAAILKLNHTENLIKSQFNNLGKQKSLEKKDKNGEIENNGYCTDQSLDNSSTRNDSSEVGSNDAEPTSIIIRGIPEKDIQLPLINTVLKYAESMEIQCNASDIIKVSKYRERNNNQQENTASIVVKFKTLQMKITFLVNREKFISRNLKVSEFVDGEIKDLKHYAQSLRSIGYKAVFFKNNKVFVKLNYNSPMIRINSKKDVDDLIEKYKVQKNEKSEEKKKEQSEECDVSYYRLSDNKSI